MMWLEGVQLTSSAQRRRVSGAQEVVAGETRGIEALGGGRGGGGSIPRAHPPRVKHPRLARLTDTSRPSQLHADKDRA